MYPSIHPPTHAKRNVKVRDIFLLHTEVRCSHLCTYTGRSKSFLTSTWLQMAIVSMMACSHSTIAPAYTPTTTTTRFNPVLLRFKQSGYMNEETQSDTCCRTAPSVLVVVPDLSLVNPASFAMGVLRAWMGTADRWDKTWSHGDRTKQYCEIWRGR